MDEPTRNIQKGRKILFDRNSPILSDLNLVLLSVSKKVIIRWSFHFVEELLKELNTLVPQEKRPREAYLVVKDWAAGKVRMIEAKKAILACHQIAKDTEDEVLIAYYHAIGQGLSVVHTVKHALGLPIYQLTGIVRAHPTEYEAELKKKVSEYGSVLHQINADPNIEMLEFADFIK